MDLSDFDYFLPPESIAQTPAVPRDHSRLLIYDRRCDKIFHKHFHNIVDYLKAGDILLLNNSKVIPARLFGQKETIHSQVEILLNREIRPGIWEGIGKRIKTGLKIHFPNSKMTALVLKKESDIYIIKFSYIGEKFYKEIEKIGQTPLPPYIHRIENKELRIKDDILDYQTVYAKEKGSVAAPTAGLHFTPELLKKIGKKGVRIEYITLHVGLGTFAPVRVKKIENHKMHPEYFSI